MWRCTSFLKDRMARRADQQTEGMFNRGREGMDHIEFLNEC